MKTSRNYEYQLFQLSDFLAHLACGLSLRVGADLSWPGTRNHTTPGSGACCWSNDCGVELLGLRRHLSLEFLSSPPYRITLTIEWFTADS